MVSFFALGLLTFRFFQYWQREKSVVSKLFFMVAAIFDVFMLVNALVGLFFAQNAQVLKGTVVFAAFSQSFALAIDGYLVIYLRFPKISPWWGFSPVLLLGLAAAVLDIILPFKPFLESSGGINWDVPPGVEFLRLFTFLITFPPLIFILLRQMKTATDFYAKARTSGLLLLHFFAVLVALCDFLLEKVFGFGAISSDIMLFLFGLVAFIMIYITQKPPPPAYVKKVL